MGRPHNALDIHLASNVLYLRGTGVDAESAVLRGSVVLDLAEPTAFKEITMRLRRKTRVPSRSTDSFKSDFFNYGYQTNVFFIRDWSFLEGDFDHPPTLKAGRHVFPFQFELEGWLPSSLSIHGGLGGIQYKLCATAVRPVFAPNLHAAAAFRVIRSFTSEALEYQQSLDIEDTWPDKLMYSLMLPHKAWAAGDTVTTLVKFSPLMKGVCITDITTTIQQLIKTYANASLTHEETSTITTAKHEIRNGHAVALQDNAASIAHRSALSRSPSPVRLLSAEGTFTLGSHQPLRSVPSTPAADGGMYEMMRQHSSPPPLTTETLDVGEEDVSTTLSLELPAYATPSHAVEPIVVSHRINWRIFLTNPDGHMSELFCSLPLHVLDHAVLDDVRVATHATHRLLFDLEESDAHGLEELELPSYPAHVLDCVPDASHLETNFLSDSLLNRPAVPRSSWPLRRTASLVISALSRNTDAAARRPSLNDRHSDRAAAQDSGFRRQLSRSSSNLLSLSNSTRTSRQTSRASSRVGSPVRTSGSRSSHESRTAGTQDSRGHRNTLSSLGPFSRFIPSFRHSRRNTEHRLDAGASDDTANSRGPASETPGHSGSANDDGNSARSAPLSHSLGERMAPGFSEAPRCGDGVTPLAGMCGLPSYEEAERGRRGGPGLAPHGGTR